MKKILEELEIKVVMDGRYKFDQKLGYTEGLDHLQQLLGNFVKKIATYKLTE